MGKAAILLVVVALIVLGMRYGDMATSTFETGSEQSDYQEKVIARELATSAFNLLESRARNDFDSYRPSGIDVAYGSGVYQLTATGPAAGPVELSAAGIVGEAMHEVTGKLIKIGESKFAAFALDGPVSVFDIAGKSYLISGVDSDPPSGLTPPGPPLNGAGLHSVLSETDALAQAAFENNLVIGAAGNGSFSSGIQQDAIDISALIAEARAHPQAIEITGNVSWGSGDDIGSPAAPAVVIVNGNFEMKANFEGYGLLVVEGSISTAAGGGPKWEGLVILRTQGGTFRTRGNPEFWGAVLIQSVTPEGETGGEEDAGLEGGHFDVSVFTDNPTIPRFQEHQYDDRYDQEGLNLIRLGCEDNGGLCWDEAVEGSGAADVEIEFLNPAASGMTFILETNNAEYSGAVIDGASYVVRPNKVKEFRVNIAELCALGGSQPAQVAADAVDRDGAFTVRARNEATGTMLWETVAYHHVQGSTCDMDSDGDGSPVDVPEMNVVIEFAGNPRLQLSSAALSMVGSIFPQVETVEPRIVLRDVRETSSHVYVP